MTVAELSRVYRNDRVAARAVEGSALVVVLDKRELHRLNGVGARVWELCDGRNVAEICDQVQEEFDVERAQAMADLTAFIETMEAVGALRVEGP
ncbi:MAG: PqqD family protein [Myxococcales bacterium]|nr:PqqD family protein [Myxococcales bacterium]